jgi:hypothetical protein
VEKGGHGEPGKQKCRNYRKLLSASGLILQN